MNALKPRAPFQVLIMSEEARLGREQIETAYALKQILDADVRVFFYLEDRERTLDSAMDKMMAALSHFGAEMEREKARQRTYDALARKARALHVTGGKVYGYDNIEICDTSGQRLHVVRPDQPGAGDRDPPTLRRVRRRPRLHAPGQAPQCRGRAPASTWGKRVGTDRHPRACPPPTVSGRGCLEPTPEDREERYANLPPSARGRMAPPGPTGPAYRIGDALGSCSRATGQAPGTLLPGSQRSITRSPHAP
jgi:hypothetical protein